MIHVVFIAVGALICGFILFTVFDLFNSPDLDNNEFFDKIEEKVKINNELDLLEQQINQAAEDAGLIQPEALRFLCDKYVLPQFNSYEEMAEFAKRETEKYQNYERLKSEYSRIKEAARKSADNKAVVEFEFTIIPTGAPMLSKELDFDVITSIQPFGLISVKQKLNKRKQDSSNNWIDIPYQTYIKGI